MLNNFKIAIINDEISDDLRETIKFLKSNKVRYIELRTMGKRNLVNFTLEEAEQIYNLLRKNKIKVSAIASPLFKWYPVLKKFHSKNSPGINNFFFNPSLGYDLKKKYIIKTFNLAKIFKTKYIRIFSSLKKRNFRKYSFFTDPLLKFAFKKAQENNIVLLLENEPSCYLQKIEQFKEIVKKFPSENLRLLFDIANFYKIGTFVFYNDLNSLKNEIRYFHLKDFINGDYVSFGNGSINYKRIISDIKRIFNNKELFLSLETHVNKNSKIVTLESLKNLRRFLRYKRISYGIIGCGRVFKKHASAISNDKNSELRAVFDIKEKRTKIASLNYDCEKKQSLKELLNDAKIQAVNICTPHNTHKELILKTIAANKYCLCEKPLCLSKKEGEEILNNKNYKNNVFVVLQNRFNSAVRFLFKLINNNLLGKIRLCSVAVKWWRENKYFKDEWHGDIKKVGGMLFNQGVHTLDLMLRICGESVKIQKIVKKLRNFSTVDDIFIANVVFKSGVVGNVEVTTYTKYKDFEASIFVIGDKGSIKIGGPGLNRVEYLNIKNERILKKYNKHCEEIEEKYGKGHQRLITAFSKYLLGSKRNPNLASAEEGAEVTEFIEKLYKS